MTQASRVPAAPANGTPLVELMDIHKRFGTTVTAEQFSLRIERGEFFTLLGPSGSGKSTILRMLAGLEHPDSGQVLFSGRDLAGVPPWKRNLGMMFQQYAVFPHMTVAQNVAYGLKARSMSAQAQRARAKTGERRKRIAPQLLGKRLCFSDAEHADVGRLVVLRILARGLAQRRRRRIGIEHVIHHLERKPDAFGKTVELHEPGGVERCAAAGAEQRRGADQRTSFVDMHELEFRQ